MRATDALFAAVACEAAPDVLPGTSLVQARRERGGVRGAPRLARVGVGGIKDLIVGRYAATSTASGAASSDASSAPGRLGLPQARGLGVRTPRPSIPQSQPSSRWPGMLPEWACVASFRPRNVRTRLRRRLARPCTRAGWAPVARRAPTQSRSQPHIMRKKAHVTQAVTCVMPADCPCRSKWR